MSCVSCSQETIKYRCKRCPEYTCSLTCHNAHESQCDSELIETSIGNVTSETSYQSTCVPFKTEDTVESVKLRELENSKKLKELLGNPHLREFILQVDRSPNAWKAMKIAMLEPLFIEFANECLNVVEPDL